jgi:hypothetical protein
MWAKKWGSREEETVLLMVKERGEGKARSLDVLRGALRAVARVCEKATAKDRLRDEVLGFPWV